MLLKNVQKEAVIEASQPGSIHRYTAVYFHQNEEPIIAVIELMSRRADAISRRMITFKI